MLSTLFYTLLGLIIGPCAWLLRKLGMMKPAPPVPKHFQDFNNYLWGQGLRASVSVQEARVHHAESLAYLQFGIDPSKFLVVTLTNSTTPEEAELLEKEALTTPQFSGVCRNGTLVMACSFNPPAPELESRMKSAFMRYAIPN